LSPEVETAAVSAVAEVDRPQPGGAGCGRFFPCFVIYPEAALSAERNTQPVGPFKVNGRRKSANGFLAHSVSWRLNPHEGKCALYKT